MFNTRCGRGQYTSDACSCYRPWGLWKLLAGSCAHLTENPYRPSIDPGRCAKRLEKRLFPAL